MAAHLTLTQGDVVQIHDPEPHMGLIQWQYVGLQNQSLWFDRPVPQYSPVVQMANAPDCLSGDHGFESRRGCHTAPSSNRRGRQPLKLVMMSSSLTGVTRITGMRSRSVKLPGTGYAATRRTPAWWNWNTHPV